jgi:uncharacterized protein (TIGR03437 family)
MKLLLRTSILGAAIATAAFAQPTISSLANNYSWVLAGLPNYGIAQGSIFAIMGSGLADSGTGLTTPPPVTLNNVSVSVTVNGTTVKPLLYYVLPTQIGAILPSSTPVGTGTITVTNGSRTSAAAPIKVVESLMGLLTLNGGGTGPVAGYIGNDPTLIGLTNAPNPGETVVLWGSGLGPVAGDGIAQAPATSQPSIVEIGGLTATVAYAGRSGYAGLDQINVVVPNGAAGCYVSVAVRNGSYVSNFATIPVAASGRTCSDVSGGGYTATQLAAINGKSNVRLGSIGIGKSTFTTPAITFNGVQISPASTTTTDSASASFYSYTAAQFQASAPQTTSIGSCTVYTYKGNTASNSSSGVLPTGLDAGAAVNVNGPNGKLVLSPTAMFPGIYSPTATNPSIIPAKGGSFTFDNGSGGADVKAFTAGISVASPLEWTNMSSISAIDRTKGVTVTWTGGDGYVQISGYSFSAQQASSSLGGTFVCTAPASARTFTVPASVLLSLPPSYTVSAGGISMSAGGVLGVSNYANQQSFTANGLDLAYVLGYVTSSTMVTYQ